MVLLGCNRSGENVGLFRAKIKTKKQPLHLILNDFVPVSDALTLCQSKIKTTFQAVSHASASAATEVDKAIAEEAAEKDRGGMVGSTVEELNKPKPNKTRQVAPSKKDLVQSAPENLRSADELEGESLASG